MRMAGVRLPLESFPLQALVSEPVKPVFPCVVMSNTIHAYISQSDKGELVIGAGTDAYTSYTQRGALHVDVHTLEAICELFPMFRRLRMLRNWGGIVDVTPDRSPIIGKTPVPGLYVNCGWGTGGFKATPGSAHVFAWTMAHDEPHPIDAPFSLERFRDGRLIDEAAAAGGRALMLLDRLPVLRRAPGDRIPLRRRRRTSRGRRDPSELGDEEWAATSTCARTRAGVHAERWRHVHGCGRFFNAVRDTTTRPLRRDLPASASAAVSALSHRRRGGRVDRARAAPLHLRRPALRGLRRRHARLGAARERRAPGRPLLQVPSPARHPDGAAPRNRTRS